MKYYLEVLDVITRDGYNSLLIKTKKEFSTKAKAMTAFEKKEINTNQRKRIHLCTHDESDKTRKACKVIDEK